jgi:hypothetical protein
VKGGLTKVDGTAHTDDNVLTPEMVNEKLCGQAQTVGRDSMADSA